MTRITEQRDVQDQLINHPIGVGWCCQPPVDVAAEEGPKIANAETQRRRDAEYLIFALRLCASASLR
jgi:hypothetical protein